MITIFMNSYMLIVFEYNFEKKLNFKRKMHSIYVNNS